jgi:hypothetical protein
VNVDVPTITGAAGLDTSMTFIELKTFAMYTYLPWTAKPTD